MLIPESDDKAVPELSDYNLKILKGAYRHPFEYITPKLYRKKDIDLEALEKELHVVNEEEFNELMRDARDREGTIIEKKDSLFDDNTDLVIRTDEKNGAYPRRQTN